MTVNATATKEFTIEQIVTRAFHTAGLLHVSQSPNTAESGMARDFLDIIVDHAQAMGLSARAVDFYDLALTVGTHLYSLPNYVLELGGDCMYIPSGETDLTQAAGETLVAQIDRDTWNRQAHNAEGRPTTAYAHRVGATVQLRLWPIPDEAGTLRVQYHRLLGDNNAGENTPDLERYWVRYLVFQLAHDLGLASSLPGERCAYLQAQATEALQWCRAQSKQHVGIQMRMSHRTAWR
jgi:hypothetical protein